MVTWPTCNPTVARKASMYSCTNGGFRRARIGILGNDEDQCESCETVVGFGLQGSGGDLISCGGSGNLKSVCYIFVQ